MKKEIRKLKELRDTYASKKVEYEKLFGKFQEDNQEVVTLIKELKMLMEKYDGIVRGKALKKFKKTGDKKLDYGVEVKLFDLLDYDEKEALEWAKETGLALQLNKKVFIKHAKADSIGFVTYTQEPKAMIPKVLKMEE